MTWLSLLRRAWAVWKLRKKEFHDCQDCGMVLTEEEAIASVLTHEGWRCGDCLEIKRSKAYNDIPARMVRESYHSIFAPGLLALRNAAMANQQQAPQDLQDQLRNQQQSHDSAMLAQVKANQQAGALIGGLGTGLAGLFGRGRYGDGGH